MLGGPGLVSAIDSDSLSADELAQRSGEEFDDSSHLVDRGDSFESTFGDHPLLVDISGVHEPSGACITGCEAVDGDVVRSELLSEASSVGHLTGLGRGIDGTLCGSSEGCDRADRDDPSSWARILAGLFVALDHPAGDVSADEDGGQQVAVEHGLDVIGADHHGVVGVGFSAQCGDIASGVVDQDVDWSQLLCDIADDPFDVFAVSKIGEYFECLDLSEFTDFSGGIGQRGAFAVFTGPLLPHSVDTDFGSGCGEVFGERSAESSSGAGHQRHLAFKKSGHD